MAGRRNTLIVTGALVVVAGFSFTMGWVLRAPAQRLREMPRRVERPSPDEPRRSPHPTRTPPLWVQPNLTDHWQQAPLVNGMRPPRAVIVIGIDTLRADHMSAYGYDRDTTPNLKRLAATEGIAFENAYSTAPWTLPSMTSIFTSLWTPQHQVVGDRDRLSPTIPTLAGAFATQGWLSAAFVTHLYVSSLFGLDSGFEEFRELGINWNVLGEEWRFKEDNQLRANELNDYVFPWLARHSSQRFFLYLHYFDPHWDYDPPAPFNTRFIDPHFTGPALDGAAYLLRTRRPGMTLSGERLRHLEGLYDGEIAFTDEQLGRLFERLKALGLWDQTLLVVVSDHGEEFMEHGSTGHSKTLYTELTHVPLIVKPPDGVPDGWRRRIDARVRTIDVAPTVLQWARLRVPDTFSGQSLVPLMRAAGTDRPVLEQTVTHTATLTALMDGPWKLIRSIPSRRGTKQTPSFELFDLRSDPQTMHDVAAGHPQEAQKLSEEMKTWLETEAAPLEKGKKPAPAELSPAQERELKALGYL